MRNRSATVPLLAAFALALSACGAGDVRSAEGEVLSTVEHALGTTTVYAPDDGDLRVVALGWTDAEVALSLGVQPVAVHDWLGLGEQTHGVGFWASDLYTDVDPTVIPRSDDGVDYELVQSFDPDLILNVNSGQDELEHQRLSEIAPTISAPVGTDPWVPGWDAQTLLIAQALGKDDEGRRIVSEVEARFEQVRDEHPEFAGIEAVAATKVGDAYGLYLEGDTRWNILEGYGFALDGPAEGVTADRGFSATIPQERVDVFDVDLAVVFPIGYSLEELEADPLLASLDVVDDGRAVFLGGDDGLADAFSAGGPLSIGLVLDELTPRLAEAAAALEEREDGT